MSSIPGRSRITPSVKSEIMAHVWKHYASAVSNWQCLVFAKKWPIHACLSVKQAKANLHFSVYIRIICKVPELCERFEIYQLQSNGLNSSQLALCFEIYQLQSKGLTAMNLELSVQTIKQTNTLCKICIKIGRVLAWTTQCIEVNSQSSSKYANLNELEQSHINWVPRPQT